ncbi:MAG: CDP-glycerol glycerophosphotransferase family protein, partial [Actinomycetota bacterium]|nr:CDP-glycerol glycerophosphotransferase family protein [Actinomycetota bacterium]
MTSRVLTAARSAAWVLLRVLPPRRHAVVHGWPDNEANAVEVVRALRRRYSGTVYWSLDDPSFRGPAPAAAELADPRIRRVRRRSLRALAAYVTAEVTFFTHGLYTAVKPPRTRLVVNLWHGDGPKATRQSHLVRSTVVVSGTQLWGRYKGELFGVGPGDVAVVGNPRVDEFDEELPGDALPRLGLSGDRPIVLWLPTYREARGPRA